MAKKPIDYTSFSGNGPKQGEVFNQRWWKASQTDMPAAIAAVVGQIQDNSRALENQRQISIRLYSNSNVLARSGLNAVSGASDSGKAKDRISYNVIQSGIDTVVAQMAKNKPRPLFLTSGARIKLQRKAKKLDKFVEGVMYENKAYQLGPEILRDAMAIDTGIVHVFTHNGRVKYERTLSSELFVDEQEAFYGQPRQLHRIKNYDRAVLMEMFPEKANAIKDANGSIFDDTTSKRDTVSDQITVIESWYLPSGPEAGDGKHVIVINGKLLFTEEWTRDHFPFAFLRWNKRLFGFWGQSAAEQIQNIQLEVNKLLWVIQRSMHLAGTFKVWLKNGSKVVKEHMNNDIGTIINGEEPPQYLLAPTVQPEVFQHLQTLKAAAYEQLGISQLSATSKKPEGLNSGKALREYSDIESDRQTVTGQAYEQFFLDLAKLTVAEARVIALADKKNAYKVKVPGKRFIDEIAWDEVAMEDDEFVMKLYPVSSLPDDPAGRLQTIQEYMQAGVMGQEQGRRLLDFPDLEATEELANAPEDRIHKIIEAIIDDGEYTPPDQYMPLDLAKKLSTQYYNWAIMTDLEPERLQLILNWDAQVDALQQAMEPPPMPMDPSMGAAAPANPVATPTTDLVPNVNPQAA